MEMEVWCVGWMNERGTMHVEVNVSMLTSDSDGVHMKEGQQPHIYCNTTNKSLTTS